MYFSQNAFTFGLLIGLGMVLTSLLHSFCCMIWRVPIQKVSVFFDPWFSIKRTRIELTEFSLGWLPLGSYIMPLRKPEKENDISLKLNPTDLYLDELSSMKQRLFKLIPFMGLLLIYLISLIILDKNQSVLQNFTHSWILLYKGCIALFSSAEAREEYGNFIRQDLTTKSVLGVATTLYMGIFILSLLITPISNLLTNENGEQSKALKAIKTILFFLFAYLIFWKFPVFIFSYFSGARLFSYFISSVVGISVVGIIIFCLILLIYKLKYKV